jgi:hypothetical protein
MRESEDGCRSDRVVSRKRARAGLSREDHRADGGRSKSGRSGASSDHK